MSVEDIESEGDKFHSRCIKALYSDESLDAKTVFAWSNIYDEFESCLDSCERGANAIEQVVMKNS